jgi:hypothetical protein
MRTRIFWESAAERAISTAAQAAIAVLGADTVAGALGFDVMQASWLYAGSVAAGAAVLSILKSVAATHFGDKGTPSLIKDGV